MLCESMRISAARNSGSNPLTPSHSRIMGQLYTETGPKIPEQLSRESLGHNIGELVTRGNMQNPNLAKRHLLGNKIDVNLNVLGVPVLNWVGRHVDCTNVVTVNHCSGTNRMM